MLHNTAVLSWLSTTLALLLAVWTCTCDDLVLQMQTKSCAVAFFRETAFAVVWEFHNSAFLYIFHEECAFIC